MRFELGWYGDFTRRLGDAPMAWVYSFWTSKFHDHQIDPQVKARRSLLIEETTRLGWIHRLGRVLRPTG